MVLPPVQCGQVSTQLCSQVEEDHIEWDACQGKKTQKVCPSLCWAPGFHSLLGKGACIAGEERDQSCLLPSPTLSSSRDLSLSLLGEEKKLFPWHPSYPLLEQSLHIEGSSRMMLPP